MICSQALSALVHLPWSRLISQTTTLITRITEITASEMPQKALSSLLLPILHHASLMDNKIVLGLPILTTSY